MINLITCLNGVEGSGEGEKFVGKLLNYVDDKIKGDNHGNIMSSK